MICMKQPVVYCNPELMGGTAVFHGTRVPAPMLLDSVTREQVIAFLEEAKDRLIETVS